MDFPPSFREPSPGTAPSLSGLALLIQCLCLCLMWPPKLKQNLNIFFNRLKYESALSQKREIIKSWNRVGSDLRDHLDPIPLPWIIPWRENISPFSDDALCSRESCWQWEKEFPRGWWSCLWGVILIFQALFCLQPSTAIPTRLGWSSLRDPRLFQAIRGSGMSLCTLTQCWQRTPLKRAIPPLQIAPAWHWVSVSHHKPPNQSSFLATEGEMKERHGRRKLVQSRRLQFYKGAVGQGV